VDAVEGNDLLFARWYNASVEVSQWEPNNINNVCMIIEPRSSFTWSDADCMQLHGYICQQGQYSTLCFTSNLVETYNKWSK